VQKIETLTSLFKLECNEHARCPRAAFLFAFLAGLLAAVAYPSIMYAQLNSSTASVNLNAVLNTSLTLSAAPGLVNFALLPSGVASGGSTINITTTWTLRPSVGAVTVWAYFSSVPSALSDGTGDNIPSASVTGSPNGGAFAPFTGSSPFAAGSSLQIYTLSILGNNKTGTRIDTLNLKINTTGLNLPAGTYTGTLILQGQAL
jgi:hypothetical protein